MRIVHFTGAFLPIIGGAPVVVHNLALEQAKAGHQVYVLNGWTRNNAKFRRRVRLPYQWISLPPRFKMEGIACRPFKRKVLSAWLEYLQMRFRFDAWHLHYAYPIGSALPLLQRMEIEPVLTCHGIDIQTVPAVGYGLRLDPEIDREVTSTLRRCKKLVGISSDIRKKFLEAGCSAQHVFEIPNGVSVDHMNSISRKAAAMRIRSKCRLPPGSHIILTVGRYHPVKRFDLIPEMIASLVNARKDFVWVVVGTGCASLVDAVADRGLDDYLRLLGPFGMQRGLETEVPSFPSIETVEILRASDVFAFPTRVEGMPLVVLEAMAAGLPVVSMDVPGVRDLVESGVNGVLSEEGQAEDMAQNIKTLLSDPQMRKEMGVTGQQKARRYDWAIVAQQYVDLYSR